MYAHHRNTDSLAGPPRANAPTPLQPLGSAQWQATGRAAGERYLSRAPRLGSEVLRCGWLSQQDRGWGTGLAGTESTTVACSAVVDGAAPPGVHLNGSSGDSHDLWHPGPNNHAAAIRKRIDGLPRVPLQPPAPRIQKSPFRWAPEPSMRDCWAPTAEIARMRQ